MGQADAKESNEPRTSLGHPSCLTAFFFSPFFSVIELYFLGVSYFYNANSKISSGKANNYIQQVSIDQVTVSVLKESRTIKLSTH